MNPGKEEQIRARAYELWEKEGRPSGREREHWEQARREIEGDAPPASGTARSEKKAAPKRPRKSPDATDSPLASEKPRRTATRSKKPS